MGNWNLHYRNLIFEKDRYYVNGEPLKCFHFSQYDPDRRDLLSTYQNRIQLHEGTALARLCDEYADALIAHGYEEAKNWPYTYGTLPNGLKLDKFMRRLYWAGFESGELDEGSIFTLEGADRFAAWLEKPAPVGGKHGVTRYAHAVHSGRTGLRRRFPNLDGPEGAVFVKWASRQWFVEGDMRAPTATRPSIFGRVAGFARRVLGPALGSS